MMATEKRLIDANALVETIVNTPSEVAQFHTYNVLSSLAERQHEILNIIDEQPTVDAVEVVHGRWIDRYGGKYAIPAYDCSECKKSAPLMHDMDMLGNWKARQFFANYCPNCGAKMDGGSDG